MQFLHSSGKITSRQDIGILAGKNNKQQKKQEKVAFLNSYSASLNKRDKHQLDWGKGTEFCPLNPCNFLLCSFEHLPP
jgi:hypothetical protein